MQSLPQIFLIPDEIKLTQLYIELFERYEKTHGPICASNPRDVAAQMVIDLYAPNFLSNANFSKGLLSNTSESSSLI